MIQDIWPHQFHNEFRPGARPGDDSIILCFDGKKLMLSMAVFDQNNFQLDNTSITDEDILSGRVFPSPGHVRRSYTEKFDENSRAETNITQKVVYAFSVDNTEFFLYTGEALSCLEGFAYIDINQIRRVSSNLMGMITFTGYHLYQWYTDSVHCGRCGGVNEFAANERAMHCPICDRNIYPRIMPAVIIGVTDGDRLLVTKYKGGFSHFALVAGFTEIGETLEETVAREVMEETGLKVKNIRYYKSQPWGIANDILAGFFCDVDGSTEIRMDENELKLAEWRERSEIELQPDNYSLTNEMMRIFREGLEPGAYLIQDSEVRKNTV